MYLEEEVDGFGVWGDDDEFILDDVIRSKHLMDGASSLAEAASRLESQAAWLRQLQSRGFLLRDDAEDGLAFVFHPDGLRIDDLED